jgi:hypothetical protein
MISNAALKAGKFLIFFFFNIIGFSGSVVIDYPNSAKAKKIYLVLTLGGSE